MALKTTTLMEALQTSHRTAEMILTPQPTYTPAGHKSYVCPNGLKGYTHHTHHTHTLLDFAAADSTALEASPIPAGAQLPTHMSKRHLTPTPDQVYLCRNCDN